MALLAKDTKRLMIPVNGGLRNIHHKVIPRYGFKKKNSLHIFLKRYSKIQTNYKRRRKMGQLNSNIPSQYHNFNYSRCESIEIAYVDLAKSLYF